MIVIGDPVLEVYRMYVDYRGELDLILGEIDAGTYEYSQGLRFYGSLGGMYKKDGNLSTEDPTRKLRRRATDAEIASFKGTNRRISLDHVDTHPAFRMVCEIPDFKMDPEKVYIDRMGFYIQKMHYSLYSPDGRAIGTSLPSMRDVVWETDVRPYGESALSEH